MVGSLFSFCGNPENFIEFQGDVYFTAYDPELGRELWKWDGEEASLVVDVATGPDGSSPNWLTVFDNALYFTAWTREFGRELWKWDGKQATQIADINPLTNQSPIHNLTVYDNALYFSASDGVHGQELWRLAAVPEPSALILLGMAFLLLVTRRIFWSGRL